LRRRREWTDIISLDFSVGFVDLRLTSSETKIMIAAPTERHHRGTQNGIIAERKTTSSRNAKRHDRGTQNVMIAARKTS